MCQIHLRNFTNNKVSISTGIDSPKQIYTRLKTQLEQLNDTFSTLQPGKKHERDAELDEQIYAVQSCKTFLNDMTQYIQKVPKKKIL